MPDGVRHGARFALRDATADIHARLHGVAVFRELAEGSLTRPAYVALLRRLLGFHAAIEAAVAVAPPVDRYGLDSMERQRSGLLRDDLASLCATAETPLAPVPVLDTAARVLGCLYVTEGSTLGGRHLARGLDHLLPDGATAGRSFLLGYGARHAAMWQSCCTAVEACGDEPDGLIGMTAAAQETFAAFEAWFASAADSPRNPSPP